MVKTYGRLFLARSWKKYMVVVLLVVLQCILIQNRADSMAAITHKPYELSVSTYIAAFYSGSLPFNKMAQQPFNIPPVWSAYFLYFFGIIARTAAHMYQEQDRQLLLRCVTRKRWWNYQNLLLWMEAAGYVAVTYVAFFLFALCTGTKIGGIKGHLLLDLTGLDLRGTGVGWFLLHTVVVPFLVMLAMAYVQYVISLAGNVIIGLIIPVVLLVASAFTLHPLLLGNYMMLMRDRASLPGGVSAWAGILAGIVIMAAMYGAGRLLIKKKDLF